MSATPRTAAFVFAASCACTGSITEPESEVPSTAGSGGRRATATAGATNAGAGAGGTSSSGAGGRTPSPPLDGGRDGEEADAGVVTRPPPREYCDAVSKVFLVTCGNGSCHSNPGATIGDFAVGPREARAYLGRGSAKGPACGLIIDPREPQDSLILTKVTGDYPMDLNCGGLMPVGAFEVTDAQIDCIADWVEQFRN